MKVAQRLILSVALLVAATVVSAEDPVDSVAEFHSAIHKAFGLPEPTIVQLLGKGVKDEELPAVALISSRAKVEITDTSRCFSVAMKSSGISWSRTLWARMLTPWSTILRASASSTIWAIRILPCLRA